MKRYLRHICSIAVLVFMLSASIGSWVFFAHIRSSWGRIAPLSDPQVGSSSSAYTQEKEVPRVMTHMPAPLAVRGFYWTARTAGIASRVNTLTDYALEHKLNAVVIDLKLDDGTLAFVPSNEQLNTFAVHKNIMVHLDDLLQMLGEKHIYRIARIPVMRDGALATAHPEIALRDMRGALWRDNIQSLWVDPAAPLVSQYALMLAQEAYARGFDEVQFDYVRFPSDGTIGGIRYPVWDGEEAKTTVMQRFFKTVGDTLKSEHIPVSFDLFGITFWSTSDYNIGQRLIDVYPYADYISPMVYPSHYPAHFQGYANPARYPFEVINSSIESGVEMLSRELGVPPSESRAKLRPWLQDFDLGVTYTPDLIEAEIRAAMVSGTSGWLLWNARNVYEPADYLVSAPSQEVVSPPPVL